MAEIIRAVYEHGRLRPLDPLALMDGQEVCLAILSEQERVRAALAHLLAPVNAEPADETDDAALVATIDAALQGVPPVSKVLLAEPGVPVPPPRQREEGPGVR
jgi:predicted DNA-binding antitoxin AbrB/MazE fold protein